MARLLDSSPIRLHYHAICLQHRCHSRMWMDICHTAGPFSLLAPVSPRGLRAQTLYMPTNTDLSPLSDLQTWPLLHTHSLLWRWQKGSVTQPGFPSLSGWMVEGSDWGVSLVMSVPDGEQRDEWDRCGFYGPGIETWSLTDGLLAVTHQACHTPALQNVLRALLIRISQSDLKLQPLQFVS